MRFWVPVLVISCLAILLITGTWWWSYKQSIEKLELTGASTLDQVIDQFQGTMDQYRTLPTLLARRQEVVESASQNEFSVQTKNNFLQVSTLTGASAINLLDTAGLPIPSQQHSNQSLGRIAPQTVIDQAHFRNALRGSLGFEHTYDTNTGYRAFIFARSVVNERSVPVGVVTVQVGLERFENEWSSLPHTILFIDEDNTIFLSNRSKFIFQNLSEVTGHEFTEQTWRQHKDDAEILRNEEKLQESLNLPPDLLSLSQYVPLYDMRATLLIDSSGARKQALLISSLSMTIVGMLTSVAYAVLIRRRHLVSEINYEHELNTKLEKLVSEKTHQLKETQNELVQSAKLSALGKMSAGIGHELNQPIGAIKNFAINAQKFLEKKELNKVGENLDDIATQSERIDRIIRHLREFARNEKAEVATIDYCDVVRAALHLMSVEIKSAQIHLSLDLPSHKCFVQGGFVRIEQVIVNVITNAIDAMDNSHIRTLNVSLVRSDRVSTLIIQDSGSGLPEPDSVFEPFYTSKASDQGHGLGLGLSISYGIVNSFNGSLRCRNHDGGAIFEIELNNT